MARKRLFYCALTASSWVAIAFAGAQPAVAQTGAADGAATSASAKSGGPELSEIVVTGERNNRFGTDVVQAGSFRGAKTLDTPLTVSVIPREVIDVQQAQTLQEVLQNTAGVTVANATPVVYSNLSIRGINVENRGNYRLNGILPILNLLDLPIEDKDRVEALKGASALYYGFTTPSGIINLTMKQPTPTLFLQATAFGDTNGGVGGHVDFGNTFGALGARVNGVYARVDPGIDGTAGRRSLISGAFTYKPASALTIGFDAEHIFKKVNEPAIFRFVKKDQPTVANPYPAITLPPLLDPHENFGPRWATNRGEETNLLATADWKISRSWDLNLSAGSSRAQRDRHFVTVDPGNPNTVAANGPLGEYAEAIGYTVGGHNLNRAARAELAGTFRTGPLVHELLVGASLNVRDQYQAKNTPETCIYSATGAVLGGFYTYTDSSGGKVSPALPAGAHTATCLQNYLDPHDSPQLGDPYTAFNATRINDKGVYAFDRIKFNDWLQLLAGVRRSDYVESNIGGADTYKAKPWSFSYGAVVKPIEWASLYATYIDGLESTPPAPQTADNFGVQLPASKSKQYEGGIKLEPRKGLLFQLAYFQIDRASAYVNGANLYVADGRLKYKGVEASLTGNLTHELAVYASGQVLSARQTSGSPTTFLLDKNGNQILLNGSPEIAPTINGMFAENTPKYTASLSVNYRLDALVQGLSINGGFIYTSRRALDAQNLAWVPGYTLFNLGAGYETSIGSHDVVFRINSNNLTGKRYWGATGSDLLAEGPPAVVKFSASVKF